VISIVTIGEDVDEHWKWLESFVTDSIERNLDGYTADDALEQVQDGNSVFLIIRDDKGVQAVGKIDIQPNALHVHTLTGVNLKDWAGHLNDFLGNMAQGLGKQYITSIARPGWASVCHPLGWKTHSIVIAREI